MQAEMQPLDQLIISSSCSTTLSRNSFAYDQNPSGKLIILPLLQLEYSLAAIRIIEYPISGAGSTCGMGQVVPGR